MFRLFRPLFVALFTASSLFAVTSLDVNSALPSRFSLGPDVVRLKVATTMINQTVTGANTFKGIRAGYDIIKPNSPYFGWHLFTTFNHGAFDFSAQDNALLDDLQTRKAYAPLVNTEVRFGQTFAGQGALSTLFFGVGSYFLTYPCEPPLYGQKDSCFQETFIYLTGGALISYAFGPSMTIGCHLKAIWCWHSIEMFGYKEAPSSFKENQQGIASLSYTHTDKKWGGEMGVPITWRPAKLPSLEVQLEPYYLTLATQRGTAKGFGARLLLGSRF